MQSSSPALRNVDCKCGFEDCCGVTAAVLVSVPWAGFGKNLDNIGHPKSLESANGFGVISEIETKSNRAIAINHYSTFDLDFFH